MNMEHIKKAAGLLEALAEGKTIQKYNHYAGWLDVKIEDENIDCLLKLIAKTPGILRLRPVYKTDEWTHEDVPMPACWIRHKAAKAGAALIVRVTPTFVEVMASASLSRHAVACSYKELMDFVYSTDGKTWKPCVKETEEEVK